MKKSLVLFLSIVLLNSTFAQKRNHSSYDTSKIVGFICADSVCSSLTPFRGYVIMYDPSDKELEAYKDGNKIKIKRIPDEVYLDEKKHRLLYSIITWYFVEWK